MSEGGNQTSDSSGTPLPDSLDGHFLISETELQDPNFRQTVVLIISHNEEGAFGLVVNRPAHLKLGDVVAELEDAEIGECDAYIGGPVRRTTDGGVTWEYSSDGISGARRMTRTSIAFTDDPDRFVIFLHYEWIFIIFLSLFSYSFPISL